MLSRRSFMRAFLSLAAAATLPIGAAFASARKVALPAPEEIVEDQFLTMADLAKVRGGIQRQMAEILAQTSPRYDDIPWMKATAYPVDHRTTIRTAMPGIGRP